MEKIVMLTKDEARAYLNLGARTKANIDDPEIEVHTRVLLEDDASLAKNGETGVYCLDADTWRMDCLDNRLCYGAVVKHPHKGYYLPEIFEEPKKTDRDAQGRRIIGHVIIKMDKQHRLIARKNFGLEGEVLELEPSSLRKAENGEGRLADPNQTPDAAIRFNCQRIEGHGAVYLQFVDDCMEAADPTKGDIVMTLEDYIAQSDDGRMLSALLKLIAQLGWIVPPPTT